MFFMMFSLFFLWLLPSRRFFLIVTTFMRMVILNGWKDEARARKFHYLP